MPESHDRRPVPRGLGASLRFAAVLAVVLALSACAEIRVLREAQDSFNEAAAKENLLRYGSQIPDMEPSAFSPASDAGDLAAVRAGYANTIASLKSMESKEKAVLEKEGLWGNVLALQAMAYWRLGKYDEAVQTADKTPSFAKQLGPRDKAMTEALPSLIRNDQAFHKIFAAGGTGDERSGHLNDAKGLLETAMTGLATVRQSVNENHPVQAYLIQAQLAVYLNTRDACNALFNGLGDQRACSCEMEAKAVGAFTAADKLLENHGQDRSDFNGFWSRKTGLTPGQSPRPCN